MQGGVLKLKERLGSGEIVIAPGCYDALSAVLIERAGFHAAYLSGASLAYTKLARPDIGYIGLNEVADTVSAICERTSIPLIVDCDTGFGNALHAQRTIRLVEQRGAAAAQLEDQSFPKRCGHLSDKSLIPQAEMCGKIRAAVDARTNGEFLIVARTDAIAVEGFDAALQRADAYLGAGADVIFVEAPRDETEMRGIAAHFAGRAPTLANMVEGGKTPLKNASELQTMGYSLVIFPGGTVRALSRCLEEYFRSLRETGSTDDMRSRMNDFLSLNSMIGTPETLAKGREYAA